MTGRGKRVVFLHPDLGIGGAERLVVDAAVALQSLGHTVQMVTAHHDPSHCFEETRDGTLDVKCVGDWLPRSFGGYCYALCAYIRMIYAALYLVLFSHLEPEVVICDQVSACIPFIKWAPLPAAKKPSKVIFYCHFPDQLLTDRKSTLKRLYRAPLDWLEEATTGMADIVLVNSNFTAGIFKQTFTNLAESQVQPSVLYPSLDTSLFDQVNGSDKAKSDPKQEFVFLSVNRYSRPKNLPLAIRALARLKASLPDFSRVKLIMIGGYDSRVDENVEVLRELEDLVTELGLEDHVTFKTSTPTSEKVDLMRNVCHALLYTPSGEHFGIVPLEAMHCRLPVVAVNDAGPKESVADGVTGFLCQPTPEDFSVAMAKLVKMSQSELDAIGQAGRERVRDMFSFKAFANSLDQVVRN